MSLFRSSQSVAKMPDHLIIQAKIRIMETMKRPPNISKSFDLSISYLKHMLKIGASWGVPEETLLSGSGLRYAELERLDTRVSTHKTGELGRRLMKLSGRDDLGIAFGLLIRPTSHGFLGYAVMSSATLAEAMQLLHKYFSRYIKDFVIEVTTDQDTISLTFTEGYDFGSMRKVFFEALLITCCEHLSSLIGEQLDGLCVHSEWARPPYFDQYQNRLPEWHFKQPHNQIRFPRKLLSRPLVMADEHAARLAITQLEKDIATQAMADAPDIVPRVRKALKPGPAGYPCLRDVAVKLCLSERTLKRRLSESGTSFQKLLDDVRRRQALELIGSTQISIQQIAQILGYTDPAAFTRAFKRWTGERPSDFRP